MQLTEIFIFASQHLGKYRSFWEKEVLENYPNPFHNYPTQWIDELDKLSMNELKEIEVNQNFSFLDNSYPDSLNLFFTQSKNLNNYIDKINTTQDIQIKLKGIKLKKQHEINILCNEIERMKNYFQFNGLIDFCGGKGLFAQTLSRKHNIKTISIDYDIKLQKKGINKFSEITPNITYLTHDLEKSELELSNITNQNNFLSFGLHTCGSLALKQFDFTLKNRLNYLLNFGCCYYKIKNFSDINISNFSKLNGINLSIQGLTLATKSYHRMDLNDFEFKFKVKNFRYTFHLLLYEIIGIKDFLKLGKSDFKIYEKSFSEYALFQLNKLKIEHSLKTSDLNSFFNDKEIQKTVKKMILAGIIRNYLGRVIEIYLILDRALYLQENGFNTTVVNQYFDQSISPRNLGVFAMKN